MPITEEQKLRIAEIAKKINDSTDADYYRELVSNGFSTGGKIHIKPENRGKFTELKKRTGHSATWFKEHGTPAQKKMATFALNSKHWSHKHASGGPVSRGFLTPDALLTLLQQFTPNRQTVDYPQVESLNLPEQYVPEPAVIRTPIVDLSKYESAPEVVIPYTPEASAEIIANQEYDSMLDNILNRQRYAESGFNDRAVNKSSGATGAYQIMPIAYKDYLHRGHGKEGDLMNASYNRLVRDHVVKMVPRDLGSEFYSPADTAINRHAKEMAVFNAGAVPVKRALRKAKAAGVDIVNTTDWIQYLPSKETRDYVNFVVLDQDIAGTGKNAEAYNRAYSRFQNRRDLGGMVERLKSAYGSNASAALKDKINKYSDGGTKTVSTIWKEHTGKDWSDVGKYYTAYDKSLAGNLKLLKDLNSGVYDYLRAGSDNDSYTNSGPITASFSEPVADTKVNNISIKDTAKNVLSSAKDRTKQFVAASGYGLLSMPDYIFNGGRKYSDWKSTEAGDYVYNPTSQGAVVKDTLDLSQHAVPEDMKKVFSKYINGEPLTEWEKYQCATFLTEWRQQRGQGNIRENNTFISENNYRGNAWTWTKNAQNSAAYKKGDITIPYNMYSSGFTGNESKNDVIRKTRQLASTDEYKDTVISNVRPGSIVTLLYPASDKFSDAAESFRSGAGETMSTHIGDIVEKDGKLYVRDNVGGARTNYKGHIHYRPLDAVLNGKDSDGVLITGVVNYAGNEGKDYYDLSQFGIGLNTDLLGTPTRVASAAAYRELDSMTKNKDFVMKKYGIDEQEYRELMRAALGVSLEESFLGFSENYKADASKTNSGKYFADSIIHTGNHDSSRNLEFGLKSMAGVVKPTAEKLSELLTFKDDKALKMAESKGLSNIKYRGDRGDGKPLFTLKELESLGISRDMLSDKRIMESPEVSGVMTVIALKKKKNELQEIMKDLPDNLKQDDDLLRSLLYQSWNQGTRKIREIVSNILAGKMSEDKLLQFKDATLRDKIMDKDGNLVNDDNWYTDRIARNMSYYTDNETTLYNLAKSGSLSSDMSPTQILNIQKELIRLGYLKPVIDGKVQDDSTLGPNTRKAFAAYRKDVVASKKNSHVPTNKISEQQHTNPFNNGDEWNNNGEWNNGFLTWYSPYMKAPSKP